MINIIRDIFSSKGFEEIGNNENLLFSRSSVSDKEGFWLIKNINSLANIIDCQDSWFNDAKQLAGNIQSFDKNTSLLLLYQLPDNLCFENIKDNLLTIEEDPYQFKKQVLLYTEDELIELQQQIDERDITTQIEYLISKDEVFQIYRDSYNQSTWHSLIYRLAHKIPFLSVNVKVNNGLESLFVMNNNSIEEKAYLELDNIIKDKFGTLTTQGIKELNPEDIFNLLMHGDLSDEFENQ